MKYDAIILLSGGLDSLVSLAKIKEENRNIKVLALTINYGQKAYDCEKKSTEKICKYYSVFQNIIEIDFLKKMSNTPIYEMSIDNLNNINICKESSKNAWIPNRNGLFLNIAASFSDFYKIKKIIIGVNKEEAMTFPDNTKEFIEKTNEVLKYSTRIKPEIYAPLKDMTKKEIIKMAKELKVPLKYVFSCYNPTSNGLHCKKCESCVRLIRAMGNEINKYKFLFESD